MAVSPEFRDYVLDQLRAVTPVTSRAMFGGVGIYSRGTFFALIAEDVVYLKADDTTRPEFEERGCKPFTPYGKASMNYYELPEDILEDQDELRRWTRNALSAARKKKS
ncbi:MAG TPA: TfoX/Sxy family protein [Thermoanaerobaculia bacterium]|nr:TfoX/Sxy family protein [Thermoanaerobaculia bacterium]